FALIIAAAILVAPTPVVEKRAEVPASARPSPLVGPELDDVRGGEAQAIVLTEQNLNAANSGHIQASVVGSGAVNIDGAALSNFDGVGNFVMNTGHLNNIQSSLSVTIITTPASGP
ncbi:MAG TPA: hypothetical protein VN113_11590, partial [Caulobacter sp.]|nr:hypothetical protein [Caulobacter sp.]